MMSKNDQIVFCIAWASALILDKDDTNYNEQSKAIRDKFLENIGNTVAIYKSSINHGTNQKFNKLVGLINGHFPEGQGWIPLLVCNELMGAWLTHNSKHLKFWESYDFAEVYDYVEAPTDAQINTFNKVDAILKKLKQ